MHLGGRLFFSFVAINLLLQSVLALSGNWFLGWWADQYLYTSSGGVPAAL